MPPKVVRRNSDDLAQIESLTIQVEHFQAELVKEKERSDNFLNELSEFKRSREQYLDRAIAAALSLEKHKTTIAEQNAERYKKELATKKTENSLPADNQIDWELENARLTLERDGLKEQLELKQTEILKNSKVFGDLNESIKQQMQEFNTTENQAKQVNEEPKQIAQIEVAAVNNNN